MAPAVRTTVGCFIQVTQTLATPFPVATGTVLIILKIHIPPNYHCISYTYFEEEKKREKKSYGFVQFTKAFSSF